MNALGPRGQDELAAALAGAHDAEARAFQLAGRWVTSVAEPAAKVLLSIHSRRHGDHALEIAAAAPSWSAWVPPPPRGLDDATLHVVAGLATTVGRLTALVDLVMPALATATAVPLGLAAAEASVTGALRAVAVDHQEQAAELAALLARLTGGAVGQAVVHELVALKRAGWAGTPATGVEPPP